jgi:hypothetical protein
MKAIAATSILIIVLTGCVSQQQLAQRQAELSSLQSRLNASRQNTMVTCPNKQLCDKAFRLAKVYVQENADMKLQFSDDTTVSTYNSIDYGYVALRATRTPEAGDSSSIRLVASCEGMDDEGYFFSKCAKRIVPIYEGFKPYIESRIKP